jgi:VanZ family protein
VNSTLRNQVPLIAWMLIMFWLSSIRRMPVIKSPIQLDKVAHLTVYFVLCWFSRRAFHFQNKVAWMRDNALIAAILFTCIYGYTDEFHQRFVPGRMYDYYDMLADAAGGLLYVIGFSLTTRWKTRISVANAPDSTG